VELTDRGRYIPHPIGLVQELAIMSDVVFDPSISYNPTACSYCGSHAYSIVVSGPTVPIFACTNCGLMRQGWVSESVRNSPIFTEYAGGVERFTRQRAEKEAAHKGDFLTISDRLDEFLPKKGRVLEIGCAMGTTLNGFREKGWQVLGVEPEKWTSDIAKMRHGLEVICAPFQEAGLPKESFDAILLLHVIEHVSNPFKALCDIADLVRPGGYLVLETPRYDTLMFKILRGRERSVIPQHLHYFTRATMLLMCRHAGFEVVRMDAVGRTVTLDRLSFYLAKFLGSKRATKTITKLSDFLHLNDIRIYVNLHDMMRVYLKKSNAAGNPPG
jgi:2-polyprenyl-3-methyl-5-hydroxy-6-metoxy-1,4-benzoquinol methylase